MQSFLMTGTPANAVTVDDANSLGIATGWQSNLWWIGYRTRGGTTAPGSAACGGALLNPVQCTDTTFLELLNTAIHPAGLKMPPARSTRVVEVFMPDPTLYPNAVHTAHVALTR